MCIKFELLNLTSVIIPNVTLAQSLNILNFTLCSSVVILLFIKHKLFNNPLCCI
jgi:hypothetical protein